MTASPSAPTRPNFVLIHWHDVGYHLGCYGAEGVQSPHVDRLAAEGYRFDAAFCTAPQCSPARGSLITGTYPHRNGLMGLVNRGWTLPQDQRTLPMYLGDAGYCTALIGVQHESRDAATLGYQEILAPGATTGGGRCGLVSESAVSWLEDRSADGHDSAFFASIGFLETHRPYPAELYPPADPATVHVPPFLPDNPWTREDLAAFQGSIRTADAAVGEILAALDRSGLAETTWVLFTSDHGIAFHGAKGSLYDPGIRVAFVLRPPRNSASRRPVGPVTSLTSHLDVLPTFLELAGGDVPDGLDGASLASWLNGTGQIQRDRVFAEKTYHDHYDPMRAVRTSRFKYIRSFEERPRLMVPGDLLLSPTARGYGSEHWQHRPMEELYDLDADPLERHNLADVEDYADVKDALSDELTQWQRSTGDPLLAGPVPDVVWHP